MRPSTGSCRLPHIHRPWFLWEILTTLIFAGKTTKPRRFVQNIADNFLMWVVGEPTRRGVLLGTNRDGLVGYMKFKGSLSCSEHEMLEFKILLGGSRAKSRTTTLDFKKGRLSPG